MLIPGIGLIIAFMLVPFFYSIWLSMHVEIVGSTIPVRAVGWMFYKHLFNDPIFRSVFLQSLKNNATFALVATLAIVAATIFQIIQVRHVPEYFYWKNDAQLFVYTGYGSGILALGISSVIHFIITALLGIGLTIRASRGVITQTKWYQARLVRYFFVWMAVSSVVSSIIMTSFH